MNKQPPRVKRSLSEPFVDQSSRWVRVKAGQEIIAESRQPLLLIQYSLKTLPTYFFAETEVKREYLVNRREIDRMCYWDVQIGDGRVARKAAYAFKQPAEGLSELEGYITFSWQNALITWYEEELVLVAHARDPYKRVDALPSSRHVQILVDGIVIAETHQPTLLFETQLPVRYYVPAEDVRMEYLESTSTQTICPYKGQARYYSINVGDRKLVDAVWTYPDPIPENPRIKDLFCFFNEKVDIVVDGVLQPRPVTHWS